MTPALFSPWIFNKMLDVLKKRAQKAGGFNRIQTVKCDPGMITIEAKADFEKTPCLVRASGFTLAGRPRISMGKAAVFVARQA